MNSDKLLRVGVPFLGLCVAAALQYGCRSEVMNDRAGVPPAKREIELKDNEADFNSPQFAGENNSAPFVEKSRNVGKNADSGRFVYPKFEDTDHTPIYSAPKSGKKNTAASSKSAAASSVYTVRKGDSVYVIAKRFKVKRADLMAANNLNPNSVLKIGQKLTIPGGKAVAKNAPAKKNINSKNRNSNSAPRSGLYTVRSGDSIYVIAKRCKVKRSELMALNNLNENSILRVGQTLKLPGAKVIDETSVIVEDDNKKVVEPAEKVVVPGESNDNIADEIKKEMESGDNTKEKGSASTTAEEVISKNDETPQIPATSGTATAINQDISVDDFCKQHNIKKSDLINLNSSVTETTTVLKKGSLILIP